MLTYVVNTVGYMIFLSFLALCLMARTQKAYYRSIMSFAIYLVVGIFASYILWLCFRHSFDALM